MKDRSGKIMNGYVKNKKGKKIRDQSLDKYFGKNIKIGAALKGKVK